MYGVFAHFAHLFAHQRGAGTDPEHPERVRPKGVCATRLLGGGANGCVEFAEVCSGKARGTAITLVQRKCDLTLKHVSTPDPA